MLLISSGEILKEENSGTLIVEKNKVKTIQSQFIDPFLELLSAVKIPISILGAEIDKMSPPEVVKQFEEALSAKSEVGYILNRKSNVFVDFNHGHPLVLEMN